MEPKPKFTDEPFVTGENPELDMRKPLGLSTNRLFRRLTGRNHAIDLGGELGEVSTDNVRFRDAHEQGTLIAYIRQEATEPKVVVPVVIALGVVAAGVYNLKYRKK